MKEIESIGEAMTADYTATKEFAELYRQIKSEGKEFFQFLLKVKGGIGSMCWKVEQRVNDMGMKCGKWYASDYDIHATITESAFFKYMEKNSLYEERSTGGVSEYQKNEDMASAIESDDVESYLFGDQAEMHFCSNGEECYVSVPYVMEFCTSSLLHAFADYILENESI